MDAEKLKHQISALDKGQGGDFTDVGKEDKLIRQISVHSVTNRYRDVWGNGMLHHRISSTTNHRSDRGMA